MSPPDFFSTWAFAGKAQMQWAMWDRQPLALSWPNLNPIVSLVLSLNQSPNLINLEKWGWAKCRPKTLKNTLLRQSLSFSFCLCVRHAKGNSRCPPPHGGGEWGLTVPSQMIARQLLAVKTQCTSHPPLRGVGGSTGLNSKSLLMGVQSLLSAILGVFCSRNWKLQVQRLSWWLGVFKMAHPPTFPALQSSLLVNCRHDWLWKNRNAACRSISLFYNSQWGRGAWWGSWGLL